MSDTPTWSETWAQIRAAVKLLRETRAFGSVNSPNVIGLLNEVVTNAKGPFAGRLLAAAASLRADLSNALARGRELLAPQIEHLGLVVDSSRRDPRGILDDVRTYMLANSEALATRDFTRGSVTAGGGNVGDGVAYAITVDEHGHANESGGPFTTVLECVADAQTGTAAGAELFEVYTEGAAPVDWLVAPAGSARRLRVRARTAADGLLGNPSFRSHISSATHPFSPWYVDTGGGSYSGITHEPSDGVRPDRGSITPANPAGSKSALKLSGSPEPLKQMVPRELDARRPYALVAWLKRVDAADGTLSLRLGSKSTNVDVSTLGSGWTRLALAADEDCYYANFAQSPLTVQVELAGNTAGHLLVDDVLLAPLERYNGRYLLLSPGEVDFAVGDRFTASDTTTNDTGIQYYLDQFFGTTLPAADGGSITVADPS